MQSPIGPRISASLLVACAALVGCSSDATAEAGTETSGMIDEPGTTEGSRTTGEVADSTAGSSSSDGTMARRASVLFVVEASSLASTSEQARLTTAIDGFLESLEGIDLRIAVTTTDGDNPACRNTAPEHGAFVHTSCRDRLDDFVFDGLSSVIDDTATCMELCEVDAGSDVTPSQRWFERSADGTTNVTADLATALRCVLPQGISSCGYAQPLESALDAVARATTIGEPEHGFLFEDGLLAIVLVTHKVDCSFVPEHESIFLYEGARTFWSNPDVAATPTPAVCWNAGVACSGDGSATPYNECHAVDLDEYGQPASEPDAVLHPLSRYRNGLQGAHLYAIAGVPPGYPNTPLEYQDDDGRSNDPNFQSRNGIGPSCLSAPISALPPVRIRELIESPGAASGGLYSVCDEDWSANLARIAEDIAAALPHAG